MLMLGRLDWTPVGATVCHLHRALSLCYVLHLMPVGRCKHLMPVGSKHLLTIGSQHYFELCALGKGNLGKKASYCHKQIVISWITNGELQEPKAEVMIAL